MDTELEALEAEAYVESYADGLLDLFAGLAVAWIGIAWLWVESLAGLAGVFPAVLAPAALAVRRRLIESRTGYVRWSHRRRRWERRQLSVLLAAGVGTFAVGIAVYVVAARGAGLGSAVAGLPAILLGLPAFFLGGISGMRRLLAYGGVLVVGGATTAMLEADPGVDLLVGGAVMIAVGLVLWLRCVRSTRTHDA